MTEELTATTTTPRRQLAVKLGFVQFLIALGIGIGLVFLVLSALSIGIGRVF